MILGQIAKRNKGRRRQNKKHATKQPLMTEGMVAEVKVWLERMRDQAGRAVSLSERLSPSDMDESNDLFWALAKYAENVQESIVKLDDINKRIYPELIELDGDTWQGLKGMRSRLAHAFWNIDPQILWELSRILPKRELALSGAVVYQFDPGSVFKAWERVGRPISERSVNRRPDVGLCPRPSVGAGYRPRLTGPLPLRGEFVRQGLSASLLARSCCAPPFWPALSHALSNADNHSHYVFGL